MKLKHLVLSSVVMLGSTVSAFANCRGAVVVSQDASSLSAEARELEVSMRGYNDYLANSAASVARAANSLRIVASNYLYDCGALLDSYHLVRIEVRDLVQDATYYNMQDYVASVQTWDQQLNLSVSNVRTVRPGVIIAPPIFRPLPIRVRPYPPRGYYPRPGRARPLPRRYYPRGGRRVVPVPVPVPRGGRRVTPAPAPRGGRRVTPAPAPRGGRSGGHGGGRRSGGHRGGHRR